MPAVDHANIVATQHEALSNRSWLLEVVFIRVFPIHGTRPSS
jgi:hypothetical protein